MNKKRKQRLVAVSLIFIGVGITVALVLQALNQNINLFFTPTQVALGESPKNYHFRLGGMVQKGSVKRDKDEGLTVSFKIEDGNQSVSVDYTGILPDLFREGQGIVTTGKMQDGVFKAEEVLAKHDENYMSPEVKYAMEQAKLKKSEDNLLIKNEVK